MTLVNELNANTRNQKQFEETSDHLTSLLIAVYSMPLQARTPILEKYYRNLTTIRTERIKKQLIADLPVCEVCQGDGYVDIDGDAGDQGWDKVGEKPCPVCYPELEDWSDYKPVHHN